MTRRTYPDHPVVSVGAVVLDEDAVLLIRRAHEPLVGEWSLPGGVVEVGETLTSALQREVQEETGLEVRVDALVEVLDRVLRGADDRVEYHFVILDYLCRVTGGRLAHSSDAADARWVPIGELQHYRVTDKVASVVQRALEIKRNS